MVDYNTCDMNAVIEHSYSMHPSLLADRLLEVALIHAQAASTMHYVASCQAAHDMAIAARQTADRVRAGKLTAQWLSFDARIIAFSAACKLLCIPVSVGQDIAKRS